MPPASPAIHKFEIDVEQSSARIGIICFETGSTLVGTPSNLLNSDCGAKPSPAAIKSTGNSSLEFDFIFLINAASTLS